MFVFFVLILTMPQLEETILTSRHVCKYEIYLCRLLNIFCQEHGYDVFYFRYHYQKSDANDVAIFSNYLTAIPAMVPLRAARPRVVTRVIA